MDSLLLEENNDENESPTRAIVEEEEEKEGASSHGGAGESRPGCGGQPGYMLRKTKIGIEISSLEESQSS